MKLRTLALLCLPLLLAACGGGSDQCGANWGGLIGSSSLCETRSNKVPVASAGATQNVRPGAIVTVDGSSSVDYDGDMLSYEWRWISKPVNSAAAIASPTEVKAAFVADVIGTYVLGLVVRDGRSESPVSAVTVNVSNFNAAPVASAGFTQSVRVGQTVTLDAAASSDADNDRISYRWSLVAMPQGSAAALVNETSPRPTFVADVAGAYVASLIVNDGKVDSAPALVSVNAYAVNAAPVARVGESQSVLLGTRVTLDGSASSDADRDPLSYEWTLVSKPAGSAAVLSSSSVDKPAFVADVAGTYVASLVVSDGQLKSNYAAVSVVASVANAAPVARLDGNRMAEVGDIMTLDGRASSDPDRDELRFTWTLLSAPQGSNAAIVPTTSSKPLFVPDLPGPYVITLKVSDGKLDSNLAIMVITAVPATTGVTGSGG